MPSAAAITLLALLVLLGAAVAHADRPLDTEHTGTVPRGEIEVELGVEHARADNAGMSNARAVFATGLTNNIDVRVESAVVAIDPPHRTATAGAGDTALGVKYRLRDESQAAPAVLAALAVRLPTGDDDRGLGSPGADVTMLAVVGKRLGALTLYANAGYTIVTDDRDADAWRLAAAAEWAAGERWTAVAEIVSDIGANGADTTAVVRAGARFGATESVTLDGAVGAGVTRSSPDVVVTLGVTLKF